MSNALFEPFQLGPLTLHNRMVMAPMTRNRADQHGLVTAMMQTYYQQRASAGLIITESVPVSAHGIGYPFTPGIYTEAHVDSWRRLTDVVHKAGGRIFVQLQHCGRISHPDLLPNRMLPVAPSALRLEGQAITYQGRQNYVTPHALSLSEIADVVAQFQQAAEYAKRAGFDGVEVHGANGYLVDQFLRDGSNQRDDDYGGNVHNRMRLLHQILDAVTSVWPTSCVGVRLSPENTFNQMSDSDPKANFDYIVAQLSARELAYVHLLEGDMLTKSSTLDYRELRARFDGPYIANNGYDLKRAQAAIQQGAADLIAFGTPFLSNPDLVRRFRESLPLNDTDNATFYGGGETGYTDYPFFAHAPHRERLLAEI